MHCDALRRRARPGDAIQSKAKSLRFDHHAARYGTPVLRAAAPSRALQRNPRQRLIVSCRTVLGGAVRSDANQTKAKSLRFSHNVAVRCWAWRCAALPSRAKQSKAMTHRFCTLPGVAKHSRAGRCKPRQGLDYLIFTWDASIVPDLCSSRLGDAVLRHAGPGRARRSAAWRRDANRGAI